MSLSSPYDFIIQWHLTEKCNLRCRHCYQEGATHQEMPFPLISAVITEITHMVQTWQDAYDIEFSLSFNVTGGEPFLRADFFVILEAMINAGVACYVLSNGTLISPERARRLADLGVKEVQLSLEGPEEIHDGIRGPGSFASSLKGIRNLLDAGVAASVNTTLSHLNAAYFMDLVDLAVGLGVRRLGFSRLVPSGRGLGLLAHLLSPDEVKALYETIFSLESKGLELATGDPMAAQMREPRPVEDAGTFPVGGCAAGVAGLTILADGTVTPCRRLPLPLGRVGQDSLRQIWAVSPVLDRLRDRSQYQGKCGQCKRWANCRGCRAIAYASAQSQGNPDFLSPDPQCFIDAD